jgi:hypothetical protein
LTIDSTPDITLLLSGRILINNAGHYLIIYTVTPSFILDPVSTVEYVLLLSGAPITNSYAYNSVLSNQSVMTSVSLILSLPINANISVGARVTGGGTIQLSDLGVTQPTASITITRLS